MSKTDDQPWENLKEVCEDEDLEESETDDEDPYETPLAKEFSQLCEDIDTQIDTHVEAASKELRKAIALAEKHGVPFRSNISFLSNSYMPESFFSSKFQKLDQDVVCEIANVWGDYLFESGGWQHSSVC